MTKHERIILDKLTEDPMLSQSELAAMLGLTRSSISVYISHLMQEGYIRGRGYVLDNQKTVYVIGTSSIDYRTVVDQDTPLFSSHTAIVEDQELTVSYGGIAKNIGESMTRLGHSISCISAIGSDSLVGELLNEYRKLGINVDNMLIVPASRSSTYLELRSLDYSQVILGAANMKLQLHLTPEFLTEKRYKLRHARAIIVEDSVPAETLQYVSSNYSPVFLTCSKTTRIQRYASFLGQFNGMIANLEIACRLTQRELPAPEDDGAVFAITAQLRRQINGPLLLCYGSDRFSYMGNGPVLLCQYSSPHKNSALYAHYRDTVAASFFHCLLEKMDGEALLKCAAACRDISARSIELTNHQLCPELIADVISGKTFHFVSR